jgi:hypothetical protein
VKLSDLTSAMLFGFLSAPSAEEIFRAEGRRFYAEKTTIL